MKKVLFATTALAMSMTAGVAVAEIALTGDARMGLVYDGNDAQFSNRARIRFTATGETDGGLSFGATFRVDHERYNSADQRASNGTRGEVWVSGSYGKLSMGDVVSASEAAIGDLYSVGFTGGDFYANLNELHYLTGDGNNLDQGGNILYEYSINGFGLFASASNWTTIPGVPSMARTRWNAAPMASAATRTTTFRKSPGRSLPTTKAP